MAMKKIFFAFLLVSLNVEASLEGWVHGPDHCFYFTAPDGWVSDNVSGADEGSPMVFYPKGSTWANSPIAIYTRITTKNTDVRSIQDQVEHTLRYFKSAYKSPNIKATKVKSLKIKNGNFGEIYEYSGDRWGNRELVAYVDSKNTINFFVLNSQKKNDYAKGKEALLRLVKSYRESKDCKPCKEPGLERNCF